MDNMLDDEMMMDRPEVKELVRSSENKEDDDHNAEEDYEAIDVRKEIEEDLEDEASDVEKYKKLAKAAYEKYQHAGYASILMDIAKEEHQHNKHLKAILDDMDKHGWQ